MCDLFCGQSALEDVFLLSFFVFDLFYNGPFHAKPCGFERFFFSADEIHEYGADDRCPRVLWAFNRQQKQTRKLVCANTIDLRDIHDF